MTHEDGFLASAAAAYMVSIEHDATGQVIPTDECNIEIARRAACRVIHRGLTFSCCLRSKFQRLRRLAGRLFGADV